MQIGFKIKKVRELKNLTQDYMASQLNISQSTYSRIEKEEGDLTINQLTEISKLLDIKVEDLINFNEKVVFNNYSHATQAYIVNQISDRERDLTDKTIKLLENQITLLENKISSLETNK